MANQFSARKDGAYLVICSAPDVCKVPGSPPLPVPFPITEKLSNSTVVAVKSRVNKKPFFMFKSHTTKVTGDAPGTVKGVKSGTVGAKAEPIEKDPTFKVEGSFVVHVGHKMYMNSKNTTGTIVFAPAPVLGTITDSGEINE